MKTWGCCDCDIILSLATALFYEEANLHINKIMEHKGIGFTFGIDPKVTKDLGPKPPKAEKPGSIPKTRKLAALKQYGFLNGIPPSFSPAERFFRQRPRGYGSYEGWFYPMTNPYSKIQAGLKTI